MDVSYYSLLYIKKKRRRKIILKKKKKKTSFFPSSFTVEGIELITLHILSKYLTTELYFQPANVLNVTEL